MTAAEALVRGARRAIADRRFDEAASLVQRVRQAHPAHPGGLVAASMLAMSTGKLAQAREAAASALQLAPDDPDARLQLAFAAHALADVATARAALAGFENLAAQDRQFGRAGALLVLLSCHGQALACFDEAVALAAGEAVHWFNRGAVLRFLGRPAEAEADYDQAIALKPDDAEAHLNRAHLRTQTPAANHLPALEAALQRADSWAAKVQLHHALAKELEDLGQHQAAYAHVAEGARLRRANLLYDVADDVATMAAIALTFDRTWLEAPRREEGTTTNASSPIFVIGMPRSGTTLVERILGSHALIEACGELDAFPQALVAQARTEAPTARGKLALVGASAGFDMAALGQTYLDRAAPFHGRAAHFVDKLPLNFLYLGLIARALPDARFVHVSRHPMANCHGMLKTLFKQGYPFSYDVGDLTAYYAGYRQLLAHWADLLGDRLVEISYEALVQEQEGESRRLLERLGLEWDPACLAFHANPAPSTTQSAAQVRRPIYRDGLEAWRAIEAQLEPLRQALLAAGIADQELK